MSKTKYAVSKPHKRSVCATWELSVRQLESMAGGDPKLSPYSDAVELLQVFSFFHREKVTEVIFVKAY
jgi:hypothetical protein